MRRMLMSSFVFVLGLASCVSTPAVPASSPADSARKLEAVQQAVLTADSPARRAGSILAECDALAQSQSAPADLENTLLSYLDAALGQAALAQDKELLRAGEARAAWLLQRSFSSELTASSLELAERTSTLILDLWEEMGVFQAREAALSAGNLEPYGKRAVSLLLDKIADRKGTANSRESLLAKARRAWADGAPLTVRVAVSDPRSELLPSLPGRGLAGLGTGQDVTTCFEQLLTVAIGAGGGVNSKGLAALREHVKAQPQGDPFWLSLDLFLAVRGKAAESEVIAAFDEYLGKYPASTWAHSMLAQYYQDRSDSSGLVAHAEALVAVLPKESAYDLSLAVTNVFLGSDRLPEAVNWISRAFGFSAEFSTGAVSTLGRLAERMAEVESSDDDRDKIAGLIRGLLSEPERVPGMRLAGLRRLRTSLQRLEARKSSS